MVKNGDPVDFRTVDVSKANDDVSLDYMYVIEMYLVAWLALYLAG